MKNDKKPCAYAVANHHSTDRTEIYYGKPEPIIVCGFHAQAVWLPTVLREINGKEK